MHMMMADQSGGNTVIMREYRKGNWTVSETMVLIEAKRMDDERRMKRNIGGGDHQSEGGSGGRSKPAELRWKWVEDYCWRKGCLRSQNQCNDKWDNLMRDYKKVRDYERKINNNDQEGSYWKLEKNERKDKNLPSNMLLQIYEALVEVVEKKVGGGGGGQRVVCGGPGGGSTSSNPNIGFVMDRPVSIVQVHPSLSPPLVLPHSSQIPVLPLPPPPPPPQLQPPPPPPSLPSCQPTVIPTICDSSDSDTSEYSDSSPAKRRRRTSTTGGNGDHHHQQQGTSTGGGGNGGGGGSTSNHHEVGTAISKSASIIAEALQACEEREERRHRDLVSLHERRLKIEESKTEINRQGISGLVDAVNKLANSILALASNNKNQSPSAPK